MTEPGFITVHAKSYESIAVETTRLRFPVPGGERCDDPTAFAFWWKMMDFVFALPPPESFPRFERAPKANEREILDRFVHCAGELAESTLLSANESTTVHIADNQGEPEHIETSPTSTELIRGFIVLFRQMHSTEKSDPATFARVRETLKHVNERLGWAQVEQRDRQIKAWAQARGSLLGQSLKVRVGEKLVAEKPCPPRSRGRTASRRSS